MSQYWQLKIENMRIFTLTSLVLILSIPQLMGQIDFYGRRLTGQSPNALSRYLVIGISSEMSVVDNAANLQEFEHFSRQIDLFNLGVGYAGQILHIEDGLEGIQINLDTVVGGKYTKKAFRFYTGAQYKLWDRETKTIVLLGGSRFREGGISIAVRHEMGIIPELATFQLIPSIARAQSLFASVYAGTEVGFDSGFSMSVEESGILQVTTDYLVRDVAEGDLTFQEYKDIERVLHQSLKYKAPKNTGGSEMYFLFLLKGQMYITPSARLPIQFSLGGEVGVDVFRIKRRNQSRISAFISMAYLLY